MLNNHSNPIKTANKPPIIQTTIICFLTTAIKFRKAGLIFLLAMFFINGYFMLFDQQSYIALLEHYFSSDNHISDINRAFFKIQTLIVLISISWHLIDQTSIDLILEQSSHRQKDINSQQAPTIYITACVLWLLISYLPFSLAEPQTIIGLIKEDGFYQNCGAFFLFTSSILFFHLFYRKKKHSQSRRLNKKRNIWFFLLGLLFLFGAGEEISWGQRIFNFPTPEFMSSNIQNEFTIHNLPWFDERTEKPFYNNNGVFINNQKTGFIEKSLTTGSLMYFFCVFTLILLPALTSINSKVRKFCKSIQLPIAPIFFGLIFLAESLLSKQVQFVFQTNHITAIQNTAWAIVEETHMLIWAVGEIHETFVSFIFMTLGIWFTLNASLKRPSSNTKQTYN